MKEGTFDITSLENALNRLGEMLTRYKNEPEDEAVRDSLIQRFEFTYSITLKTLRKFFVDRAFIFEDDIKQMSFNDMVRTACELNLLKSDLGRWNDFRLMRNLTSHTYDEGVALQVIGVISDFYDEILYLVSKLRNVKDNG